MQLLIYLVELCEDSLEKLKSNFLTHFLTDISTLTKKLTFLFKLTICFVIFTHQYRKQVMRYDK